MTSLIRSATAQDLPSILHIFNEVIANTTAIYQNAPMTLDQINTWFDDKTEHSWPVLVIEDQGQAVGFASYGSFRARECYRSTVELAVHINKEHRGKGHGTRLLKALIEHARQQKFHVMMAGIDSQNTLSIQLHEKLGFKICGNIKQVAYKFDTWLDLTLMQLVLNS